MKATDTMQGLIKELARHHAGLDLDTTGWFYFKLELDCFLPLVVERFKTGLVSVAHYRTQNGDAVADPEIVFWEAAPAPAPAPGQHWEPGIRTDAARDRKWWPLEIMHPYPFGAATYAEVDTATNQVLRFHPGQQADLAEFAEAWAANLRGQGWLTGAKLVKCSFNLVSHNTYQ